MHILIRLDKAASKFSIGGTVAVVSLIMLKCYNMVGAIISTTDTSVCEL